MKAKSKRCGDNTIIPTSESQVEDGVRPGAVAVPPTVGVLLLSASEGVLTSHLNKNLMKKFRLVLSTFFGYGISYDLY